MKRYLLLFLILIIASVGCTAHADTPLEIVVKPCPTYDIQANYPTYSQFIDMFAKMPDPKDTTEGNCQNYYQYVQSYYYSAGYWMCFVLTNWENNDGHVSCACKLKDGKDAKLLFPNVIDDNGYIYFEPKFKVLFMPVIGKSYSPNGVVYMGSTVDDRIVEQLTILNVMR